MYRLAHIFFKNAIAPFGFTIIETEIPAALVQTGTKQPLVADTTNLFSTSLSSSSGAPTVLPTTTTATHPSPIPSIAQDATIRPSTSSQTQFTVARPSKHDSTAHSKGINSAASTITTGIPMKTNSGDYLPREAQYMIRAAQTSASPSQIRSEAEAYAPDKMEKAGIPPIPLGRSQQSASRTHSPPIQSSINASSMTTAANPPPCAPKPTPSQPRKARANSKKPITIFIPKKPLPAAVGQNCSPNIGESKKHPSKSNDTMPAKHSSTIGRYQDGRTCAVELHSVGNNPSASGANSESFKPHAPNLTPPEKVCAPNLLRTCDEVASPMRHSPALSSSSSIPSPTSFTFSTSFSFSSSSSSSSSTSSMSSYSCPNSPILTSLPSQHIGEGRLEPALIQPRQHDEQTANGDFSNESKASAISIQHGLETDGSTVGAPVENLLQSHDLLAVHPPNRMSSARPGGSSNVKGHDFDEARDVENHYIEDEMDEPQESKAMAAARSNSDEEPEQDPDQLSELVRMCGEWQASDSGVVYTGEIALQNGSASEAKCTVDTSLQEAEEMQRENGRSKDNHLQIQAATDTSPKSSFLASVDERQTGEQWNTANPNRKDTVNHESPKTHALSSNPLLGLAPSDKAAATALVEVTGVQEEVAAGHSSVATTNASAASVVGGGSQRPRGLGPPPFTPPAQLSSATAGSSHSPPRPIYGRFAQDQPNFVSGLTHKDQSALTSSNPRTQDDAAVDMDVDVVVVSDKMEVEPADPDYEMWDVKDVDLLMDIDLHSVGVAVVQTIWPPVNVPASFIASGGPHSWAPGSITLHPVPNAACSSLLQSNDHDAYSPLESWKAAPSRISVV